MLQRRATRHCSPSHGRAADTARSWSGGRAQRVTKRPVVAVVLVSDTAFGSAGRPGGTDACPADIPPGVEPICSKPCDVAERVAADMKRRKATLRWDASGDPPRHLGGYGLSSRWNTSATGAFAQLDPQIIERAPAPGRVLPEVQVAFRFQFAEVRRLLTSCSSLPRN